ncbi:MAG: HAMP domain-containing protein [Clostridia bacterium]|nr:HAMP domain-containing protein [Clostridia bacterium]
MRKPFFLRYYSLFFAVVLLAFATLVGYTSVSADTFARSFKRNHMEMYAQNLAHAITDYMVLDEVDLDRLLTDRREILKTTVATRAEQENLFLLVTDEKGKILLSSDEEILPPGEILPASVIELALSDRDDPFFENDLGGLLDHNETVRGIPMEKAEENGETRIVAMAFAVSDVTAVDIFLQRLMLGFFVVTGTVILITLITFFFMGRMTNRPLRLLSEAASFYARGDFSYKLPERGNGEADALMVTFNEMAKRLEQNEKDHQTFIANVSHDLRTPMTAIGGYTQNILEDRIPPEKQKHYLRVILNETQRLSRMVDTLLEATRLRGDKQHYEMRAVDLCELARVALLSFESILEEMRARVKFDARPEKLLVLADKDAVHRVIFNLVDNAAKFTPAEGEITIRIREQDKKAIFSIRNTGEGIPAEDLPHLFDRFYKLDSSRSRSRGVGLGLFIAKSIIDAHGEEIWVTSQKGEWTEFVFTLPLNK